ncbi:MAG: pentapeptide repeat-containing protein [Gammaproteobacteria bacterium]|nr:MAG: pentapeptide repeat-containing protein [Gammaproteobacteria bacterium]
MLARALLAALALGLAPQALTDITWHPDRPRPGASLTVQVAESLRAPGRELIVLDPAHQREIGRFRFGRFPRAEIRFELPADTWSLTFELRAEGQLLQRIPEDGVLQLAEAEDAERTGAATAAHESCRTLPPSQTDEEDRTPLLDWLYACVLDNAPLRGRDLRGVDLSGRSLWRADLRVADLSDASLRHAEMGAASLAGARLDGADLAGARLELADLQGASLFVTDLDGADLRNADLRDADLSHASLSNADLTGARLVGAILQGADFTSATCPDGTRATKSCRDHLELP